MKICLVSREYPPETGVGGIGTYTYELAQGLTELGHEVHVISKALDREKEYQDGTVHVHRVMEGNIRGFWRLKKYIPVTIFSYSRRVSQKIEELVKKCGIEIVEVPEWGAEGFWYSLKRKIPMVVKFHTPFFLTEKLNLEKRTTKGEVIKFLEKWTSRKADFSSAPSRQMADIVSSAFGIPTKRIEVLPLPINTDFFKPSSERTTGKKLILYPGRLENRKGVFVLAKAIPDILKKMPDAQFMFIGRDIKNADGVSSRKMISDMTGNSAQIKFIEHIERERLIEYYSQCSVCVIPSLWENFAYTALEALSCGAPVIMTSKVGIHECLSDNSGVLMVPPNDSQALADSILKILREPHLEKELSQQSRQSAERLFSRIAISKRYAKFYEDCLQKKAKQ